MIRVKENSTILQQMASVVFPGVENISVSNHEWFSTYKSGIFPMTRNIMVIASFFGSLMMASSSDWMMRWSENFCTVKVRVFFMLRSLWQWSRGVLL